MKIKTSELKEHALDWAVAKCEGAKTYGPEDFREQRCRTVVRGEYVFRYSQSWNQGGPIIEREGIEISPLLGVNKREPFRGWFAGRSIDSMRLYSHEAYGPTSLIAAMRCYVASQMGGEVEIPEELVTPAPKWFHFSQNNSGGYFIVNEQVAEDVYVQAENAQQAAARAAVIFEPYSEFCECCGERWSFYVHDDDGYDEPTNYATPIMQVVAGRYRTQARLHHINGTVETYFYTTE